MTEKLAKLAARNIRLLPLEGNESHWLAERDGCASLLRQTGGEILQAGSAGFLTPQGFAVLVWRRDEAWLETKTSRAPASADQVEQLRSFSRDLREALFS